MFGRVGARWMLSTPEFGTFLPIYGLSKFSSFLSPSFALEDSIFPSQSVLELTDDTVDGWPFNVTLHLGLDIDAVSFSILDTTGFL
jgi:hypothetical protein